MKLQYEDMPAKKYAVRKTDRKDSKMSKSPKAETPAKEKRSITRLEVFQTVVIFVLITAIAAFYGGMQFQKSQQAEIKAAVSAVQAAPAADPAKK